MIGPTSQDSESQAARDALHWVVALHENSDDPELRRRFDDWLSRSPLHRQAWMEAQHVSDLIADSARLSVGNASRNVAPSLRSRGTSRAALKLAAPAVALSLALVFYLPAVLLQLKADHVTGIGELRQVLLPDGSRIDLAAKSAIKVDFRPELRRVELLSGRVYFEVSPDASRPFKVSFANAEVVALGTAFEVNAQSDAGSVMVDHGVVQVSLADETDGEPSQVKLGQGDGVQIDSARQLARVRIDAGEVAPWREGKLIAKNRPLVEIIDEVRKYHAGIVIAGMPNADGYRVTGIFDLRHPAEALRAAVSAHGLHVRQISPWMLVVSAF